MVVFFREEGKDREESLGTLGFRQGSLFLSWVVVTWMYLISKKTSSSALKICASFLYVCSSSTKFIYISKMKPRKAKLMAQQFHV